MCLLRNKKVKTITRSYEIRISGSALTFPFHLILSNNACKRNLFADTNCTAPLSHIFFGGSVKTVRWKAKVSKRLTLIRATSKDPTKKKGHSCFFSKGKYSPKRTRATMKVCVLCMSVASQRKQLASNSRFFRENLSFSAVPITVDSSSRVAMLIETEQFLSYVEKITFFSTFKTFLLLLLAKVKTNCKSSFSVSLLAY